MKAQREAMKFGLIVLSLLLTVGMQSCKKSKARKTIAGTWNYSKLLMEDGFPFTRDIIVTFEDCSHKDHKDGLCSVTSITT